MLKWWSVMPFNGRPSVFPRGPPGSTSRT